tara:strand:+ start:6035 stop:6271 length:237 start_codon:yes stop_codon:yes gene_type:complete
MTQHKILHEYWSDDQERSAQVVYDKGIKAYVVKMFENKSLIKSVPMITKSEDLFGKVETVHSQSYAEDAAENWCLRIV